VIWFSKAKSVTSARFIAQERALVEWSQLRLFKAKERRGYLQRIGSYKYSGSAAPHRLCRASARDHVT
jgi:hypothetical protein